MKPEDGPMIAHMDELHAELVGTERELMRARQADHRRRRQQGAA